jgi:23S rRNA (cytosine1962-C5)-methyltransferase
MNSPKVTLKPGKEQSLKRFHPWIFSGAIKHVEGSPAEGEVVQVYDSDDHFLAVGHFHSGSIAVRVLSFQQEDINSGFWTRRLTEALNLRKLAGVFNNDRTSMYRLVHGEGDNLPGLIVDIYGSTAVVQCHSIGMFLASQEIARALIEIYDGNIKAVYDKSSSTLPRRENFHPSDGFIEGEGDTKGTYIENGHQFIVSFEQGQKTGFFLDQRENRLLLQGYAKGLSVLNTFAYTGGFSIYALAGGASHVTDVESSEAAVKALQQNINLNFGSSTNHNVLVADVFDYLRTTNEFFDIIILDPPAFAKHQDALKNALQAYKRLNLAAIRRLKPGGMLFTFSCSQVVSKTDFRNAVFTASAISGREVSIIHQLSQPADHPINIYHPEGEYLKGLVLGVK